MAKQIGDIILVGTIEDITFYEMDGQGYARRKNSLTGKRVKRDPRFTRTMESAHRLGRGSQLASKVYRSLPRQEQVYALFKELKRIAVLAIKEGKGEAEIVALLRQGVGQQQAPPAAAKSRPAPTAKALQQAPRVFNASAPKPNTPARRKQQGRSHRWVERCRSRKVQQRE
jgi:hypothetical protein